MCGENTDDDWIDYVECREGALEERAYTDDQHCYFITVVFYVMLQQSLMVSATDTFV